jgi:hypothetical protein
MILLFRVRVKILLDFALPLDYPSPRAPQSNTILIF